MKQDGMCLVMVCCAARRQGMDRMRAAPENRKSGTAGWKRESTGKGFTILELLIVLAVLGVLLAVALPALTWVLHSAERSELAMDVKAANLLLEAGRSGGAVCPAGQLPRQRRQLTTFSDACERARKADIPKGEGTNDVRFLDHLGVDEALGTVILYDGEKQAWICICANAGDRLAALQAYACSSCVMPVRTAAEFRLCQELGMSAALLNDLDVSDLTAAGVLELNGGLFLNGHDLLGVESLRGHAATVDLSSGRIPGLKALSFTQGESGGSLHLLPGDSTAVLSVSGMAVGLYGSGSAGALVLEGAAQAYLGEDSRFYAEQLRLETGSSLFAQKLFQGEGAAEAGCLSYGRAAGGEGNEGECTVGCEIYRAAPWADAALHRCALLVEPETMCPAATGSRFTVERAAAREWVSAPEGSEAPMLTYAVSGTGETLALRLAVLRLSSAVKPAEGGEWAVPVEPDSAFLEGCSRDTCRIAGKIYLVDHMGGLSLLGLAASGGVPGSVPVLQTGGPNPEEQILWLAQSGQATEPLRSTLLQEQAPAEGDWYRNSSGYYTLAPAEAAEATWCFRTDVQRFARTTPLLLSLYGYAYEPELAVARTIACQPGDLVALPPLQRLGYAFLGWYASQGPQAGEKPLTVWRAEADQKLYARFAPQTMTVQVRLALEDGAQLEPLHLEIDNWRYLVDIIAPEPVRLLALEVNGNTISFPTAPEARYRWDAATGDVYLADTGETAAAGAALAVSREPGAVVLTITVGSGSCSMVLPKLWKSGHTLLGWANENGMFVGAGGDRLALGADLLLRPIWAEERASQNGSTFWYPGDAATCARRVEHGFQYRSTTDGAITTCLHTVTLFMEDGAVLDLADPACGVSELCLVTRRAEQPDYVRWYGVVREAEAAALQLQALQVWNGSEVTRIEVENGALHTVDRSYQVEEARSGFDEPAALRLTAIWDGGREFPVEGGFCREGCYAGRITAALADGWELDWAVQGSIAQPLSLFVTVLRDGAGQTYAAAGNVVQVGDKTYQITDAAHPAQAMLRLTTLQLGETACSVETGADGALLVQADENGDGAPEELFVEDAAGMGYVLRNAEGTIVKAVYGTAAAEETGEDIGGEANDAIEAG